MSVPTGSARRTTDADVDALRKALRGPLIDASHADYDAARRVWNGNIDRRPQLIARCTCIEDVQAAVNFARHTGIHLSVRGGGHSAPGYGTNDDGLVIDLSPMKDITVDKANETVKAEGGVLWGELDAATQAFGLATTGGTVSNTGIGGLALGGGLGWLMGKHGLVIDNLLAADVVTANGDRHHASVTENPDLFWAIRGGGGNFGVVTSFEFQLHPVSTVLGGMVLYPLDQAGDVLRFYRDFCLTLPDEATCFAALLTAPMGMPVAALLVGYNGPIEEGEAIFAPARAFGTPLADLVAPMPYVARQSLLDAPNAQHGLHRYWRSAFAERVSDAMIDAFIEGAGRFTSPLSAIVFFLMHGKAARRDPEETAFSARRVMWDVDVIGQWEDGTTSAEHIAWVRDVWAKAAPHMLDTIYLNHVASDDKPETIRASFGSNYKRLREIKAQYDPANMFQHNANIPPASA
ncbi:MAG: FAD-binding oxidoreductase [Cytophagaceae bacterium]|nr:FAD-binding oxidoreductase [Gemmatimonadaceae bacterium]